MRHTSRNGPERRRNEISQAREELRRLAEQHRRWEAAKLAEVVALTAAEHWQEIVDACSARLGSRDAGEDAAAEGFLRMLAHPLALDENGTVVRIVDGARQGLRYGIVGEWHTRARKECERVERRAARRPRLCGLLRRLTHQRTWEADAGGRRLFGTVGAADDPAGVVLDELFAVHLWSRLSERERRVIGERLQHPHLGLAQVADRLGISLSYTEKILHRARRRVAEQIEGVESWLLGLVLWPRRRRHGVPTWDASGTTTAWAQLAAAVLAVIGTGGAVVSPPTIADAVGPGRAGSPAAIVMAQTGPHTPHRETRTASTTAPPASASASSTTPPATVAGLRTPGQETPEDTQLVTGAAAGPAWEPTIVALGTGKGCQCTVLLRSGDGGASWTADPMAMPPDADQVVLPPAYPTDPRVFVGSSALGGVASYVVPRFGVAAVPLSLPGQVALAAGFDGGDDRVFVAARTGVLSVPPDIGTTAPSWLLTYPPVGSVASISTPRNASDAALLVLAPPSSIAVGGAALAAQSAGPSVMLCLDPASPCLVQTNAGRSATFLTADAATDTVAVWWADGLARSSDRGRSFTNAPAVAGAEVAALTATGGRLWMRYTKAADRSAGIAWISTAGAEWRDVTRNDPVLSKTLWLFAAPGGRVVALLNGGGLRCSLDGGATWATRCP